MLQRVLSEGLHKNHTRLASARTCGMRSKPLTADRGVDIEKNESESCARVSARARATVPGSADEVPPGCAAALAQVARRVRSSSISKGAEHGRQIL